MWRNFFVCLLARNLVDAATANDNSSSTGKNLVFVRIQKTGSKSLVTVLEQCSFTMCEKKPTDAVDSVACTNNLRRNMLRNFRADSSHEPSFVCYIASHCGLATYEHVFNNTLPPEQQQRQQPTVATEGRRRRHRNKPLVLPLHPPPSRPSFVVTILRHPVSRVVSEYRHVCAKGRGQWDYSTLEWRSQRARNLSMPEQSQKHAAVVVDCEQASALASFATAPAHANGMRNRQTRMLAGAVIAFNLVDPRSELELYEKARDALATTVDFALVFEHFHASLIVLARKLHLDPPRHFAVVSEAIEKAPKPALDPETTNIVLQLNKYDQLLHAQALRDLERERVLGRGPFYACEKHEEQQAHHDSSPTETTTVVFTTQERRQLHYYEAARCSLLLNNTETTTPHSTQAAKNIVQQRQRAACERDFAKYQARIQMQQRRHRQQQEIVSAARRKRQQRTTQKKQKSAAIIRKQSTKRQGERIIGGYSPKRPHATKRPSDQSSTPTFSRDDGTRRQRFLRNHLRRRDEARSAVRC